MIVLIEPIGIETCEAMISPTLANLVLIEPIGIETALTK